MSDATVMACGKSHEIRAGARLASGRRLLQIANYADPLFLFHVPLCQSLQDAGWEVEFACMEGGSLATALVGEGYRVHWLPRYEHRSLSGFVKTRRAVKAASRDWDHDVIMVSTPVMSWAARQALGQEQAAIVYLAHGLAFSPMQNPLRYHALRFLESCHARWTDAVVVVNNDDEVATKRVRLTRQSGACYRLPGEGLDVARYALAPSATTLDEVCRAAPLRPGKPLVLYLSRFIPWKRPDDVLAMARLRPDWDFVMIGEGPLWQGVRTRATRSCPNVSLLPFVQDIVPWLHRASILVHPSVFPEGMPRVILEAHAAGLPTIAYDNRGIRDALPASEFGTIVPPQDVRALVLAAEARIAECATAIGARNAEARRMFVQRFAADRVGHELAKILDHVAERHSHNRGSERAGA